MKKKETVEEFIQRKNKQFENDKVKANKVKMKDIGRRGKLVYRREAWTFLPQYSLKDKVFVFERFRKIKHEGKLSYSHSWKIGEITYRIGYFIVGKIGRAKGRWVWGQYCPLIPHKDLNRLMIKAKKEGTILI